MGRVKVVIGRFQRSALRGAEGTEHNFGGERELSNADSDGIENSVGHRWRNGKRSRFADTFGSERPVTVRHFDQVVAHLARDVEHTRNLVVGKAGVDDLAMLELHVLRQREAELHQRRPG